MRIEGARSLQQAQAAYDRQSPRQAEAALALLASRRSEVALKLGPLSVRYETETPPDPRAAAREAAALLSRVQAFDFGDALDAAGVGQALGARSAYGGAAGDAVSRSAKADARSGQATEASVDETPRPTRTPASGARAYEAVAQRQGVPSMISSRV